MCCCESPTAAHPLSLNVFNMITPKTLMPLLALSLIVTVARTSFFLGRWVAGSKRILATSDSSKLHPKSPKWPSFNRGLPMFYSALITTA